MAERSEHAAGSFRFVRVGDGLRGVHGRRGLDVRERVNTRRPHWEVVLSALGGYFIGLGGSPAFRQGPYPPGAGPASSTAAQGRNGVTRGGLYRREPASLVAGARGAPRFSDVT